MRADGLAAVVLDLLIRLVGLLWRQKTWPGAEEISACGQAIRIAADGQFQVWSWIKNGRAAHRIGDLIAELGVSETNAMSEAAGIEIESKSVYGRVIVIGERLKRVGNDGQHAAILIKRETIEELEAAVDLPIQAADQFSLAKWRIETPGQGLKGTTG